MEKKLYAVVQVGWEYNDEFYYRAEGGGGAPVKLFRSEIKAKAHAYDLNMNAYKKYDEYDAGRTHDYEVIEVTEADIDEEEI